MCFQSLDTHLERDLHRQKIGLMKEPSVPAGDVTISWEGEDKPEPLSTPAAAFGKTRSPRSRASSWEQRGEPRSSLVGSQGLGAQGPSAGKLVRVGQAAEPQRRPGMNRKLQAFHHFFLHCTRPPP